MDSQFGLSTAGDVYWVVPKIVENMLLRTESATYVCSLLEELLRWYLPMLQHQDVMLRHRALLVRSVSTWPGDLVVLLKEESNSLLLLLYKAWVH